MNVKVEHGNKVYINNIQIKYQKMTEQTKYFMLIVIALSMIACSLWLSTELHKSKDEIKSIYIEMNLLRNRNYNDSILVLEYQQALDEYMEIDPQAADEFMKLIEHVNTQP